MCMMLLGFPVNGDLAAVGTQETAMQLLQRGDVSLCHGKVCLDACEIAQQHGGGTAGPGVVPGAQMEEVFP